MMFNRVAREPVAGPGGEPTPYFLSLDDRFKSDLESALAGCQALSNVLSALAALSPSADKAPYFTAADAAALMTVTSFARSLLDDGTAGDMRGTLGLVNSQSSHPANPTLTTSTAAAVMMGLGVSFTPAASGKVEVKVTGAMTNTVSGDGVTAQIAYGTGSAPTNGAAATGTTTGTLARFSTAAASQLVPFSVTDIVTLTPSTNYWFDLQVRAVTGGSASVADLTVTLKELP